MNLSELTARMAEQHRPVKQSDPFVCSAEQYLVRCRCCNVASLVWRPGDPVVECELWRAAVALGVVTASHGPTVRLHPDGRAVVHLSGRPERPWLAVTTGDTGHLDVEVFTDDEAADWPAYGAPE